MKSTPEKLLILLFVISWPLMQSQRATAQWYDQFQNLDSINDRVDSFIADYPSLVTPSVIGQSLEGRDIRAFKISGSNSDREVKPAILLNSAMHAREWVTPMANMFAAERLITQYGSDPQVTAWLDQVDVYVMPVNNPDGYEYSWGGTSDHRLWRKNRRENADGTFGVDLNRNFGTGWGGSGSSDVTTSQIYRGTEAFSEPETRALRDFYETHPNIVGNIDIHSFGQLVLGAFGYSETAIAPDQELMDRIGAEMAEAITATNYRQYDYERVSDLYIASGVQSDWSYSTQNVYSYTYELRPSGYPGFLLPEDEILPAARETYGGIKKLLDFTIAISEGDFNYDGAHDCTDIAMLTEDFASQVGLIEFQDKYEFDMNGDGILGPEDVVAWRESNEFNMADANLDGRVDDLDLSIWQANEGLLTHSHCQGDFNTDGLVDSADLAIWQAAVPEPHGLTTVLMGLLIALLSVRRRNALDDAR